MPEEKGRKRNSNIAASIFLGPSNTEAKWGDKQVWFQFGHDFIHSEVISKNVHFFHISWTLGGAVPQLSRYPQVMMLMTYTKFGLNILKYYGYSITSPHLCIIRECFDQSNLSSITFCRHGRFQFWWKLDERFRRSSKSQFFCKFKMADSKFGPPWPNWYDCSWPEPRNLGRPVSWQWPKVIKSNEHFLNLHNLP